MKRPSLPRLEIVRVQSVLRSGSSLPVRAETSGGDLVVKLRGAAQGILPLVAEIVVAEIAELLGLLVPARYLVEIPEKVPSDDRNDELRDLLDRSVGWSLGFRWLAGAKVPNAEALERLPREFRSATYWLDGLTENLDRTPRNPNILLWNGQPWLIDHGSSLTFQFALETLDEARPREPSVFLRDHVFRSVRDEVAKEDDVFGARLTRAGLMQALERVPDEFLTDVSYLRAGLASPARVRELYVAYLWKRLKTPRDF